MIDLDSTQGVIRDLSRVSTLIRVEQERHHDGDMTWIGTVAGISKGWLWLHEVRPDATWRKRPLGYRLKRITKVAISDGYLTALAAVAGSHPTGGSHPMSAVRALREGSQRAWNRRRSHLSFWPVLIALVYLAVTLTVMVIEYVSEMSKIARGFHTDTFSPFLFTNLLTYPVSAVHPRLARLPGGLRPGPGPAHRAGRRRPHSAECRRRGGARVRYRPAGHLGGPSLELKFRSALVERSRVPHELHTQPVRTQ